jgi:hypothetical protein
MPLLRCTIVRLRLRRRHATGVERAKAEVQYIAESDLIAAPFGDEDGDASWSPVILCEQIERADFERWLELHEGILRRW